MQKSFACPYDGCHKSFGSEASQNLHIKIKHNGGLKSERVALCQELIEAYAAATTKLEPNDHNVVIDQAIYDKVTITLPPGMLS